MKSTGDGELKEFDSQNRVADVVAAVRGVRRRREARQDACPSSVAGSRERQMFRTHLLISFVSLAGLMVSTEAISSTNPASPAELFKAFVASPPVIESLAFRTRVEDPKFPQTLSRGLGNSTNHHLWHARWQSNGFFLRAISHPDQTTGLESRIVRGWFFSVFERNHWLLEPGRGLYCWWPADESVGSPANQSLPSAERLKYTAASSARRLAEALNMGVMNAPAGSVRWTGNELRGFFDRHTQDITGTLTVTSNGYPASLRLKYKTPGRTVEYIVRYGFTTNLGLAYLPNRIQSSQIVNGQELERSDITLDSLKLADAPAGKEAFDLRRLATPNLVQEFHYTNGAWHVFDKAGRLVLAPRPNRRLEIRLDATSYYVIAGAVTIAFLILMARLRFNETTNSTIRKEQV